MIVLPVFPATESTGHVAAALCHEVGEELAEKRVYLSGAKRGKCWVLGSSPSGVNTGFVASDLRKLKSPAFAGLWVRKRVIT